DRRGPPTSLGNVSAPVLPQILCSVARVAEHEKPGWSRDGCSGKHHKGRCDTALDDDDLSATVSHREADVDRRDQARRPRPICRDAGYAWGPQEGRLSRIFGSHED